MVANTLSLLRLDHKLFEEDSLLASFIMQPLRRIPFVEGAGEGGYRHGIYFIATILCFSVIDTRPPVHHLEDNRSTV